MKNIFLLLLSFIIINGFNSHQIAEAQGDETGTTETEQNETTGIETKTTETKQIEHSLQLDIDYEQRRPPDLDRSSILDQSRRRYSGSTCEEEDDRKHECVDQCRYIYSRRSDRNDCEELPIAQIAVLAEIHELLEDPDDDELASINLADLEVYLNVSIAGFDSRVSKYSKSESKEVLLWIAENKEIARLFSDEDYDFKALETLFKEVIGSFSSSSETHKPFITKIDGNDKLIEVVIGSGNESALEWFFNYITEKAEGCSGDSDEVSLECFTVFCKIGKEMDEEIRESWLSFEDFEDYINDIVRTGINGNANPGPHQWDTDNIQDANDVANFYGELCGNLAG